MAYQVCEHAARLLFVYKEQVRATFLRYGSASLFREPYQDPRKALAMGKGSERVMIVFKAC